MHISIPADHRSEQHQLDKNHARARQEQVNRRFKEFAALHQCFRNDKEKHGMVFWAVAIITQLSLKFDENLIDIVETMKEASIPD